MDFKLAYYMLLSFLVGYIVAKSTPIYIGYDEEKYDKANFGILLK